MSDEEYTSMLAKTGKGQRDTSTKTSAKRNKFGAVPTYVDDLRFPSKGEAKRYSHLVMMQKAGLIQHLRRQVPYRLVVNGILVCTYKADFVYFERGKRVIEDFKGHKTDEYKIKAKLFYALSGVKIRETSA